MGNRSLFSPAARARRAGPLTIIGCRVHPWRDLYGDWKNTHRPPRSSRGAKGFCRWRDRGVWARLLDAMIDDPDFEWLMIDASYIKAHPHSAGARGGNQAIARTKGG